MTHSSPTRFRVCFGAALLTCLLAVLAAGQGSSGNPADPAQPKNVPIQTPSPFPVIERTEPSPTEVARGTGFTFRGQNFPAKPDDIKVFLNGEPKGTVYSVDATTLIVGIPKDMPLGKYNVSVTYKDMPVALPNRELTVYKESGPAQPKINAIVPLVTYPNDGSFGFANKDEIYGFDIIGEGFSTKPSDNGLLMNQSEITVCWEGDPASAQCVAELKNAAAAQQNTGQNNSEKTEQSKETRALGTVISPQQLHFQWQVPARYKGGSKVQVRVGQTYSQPFDVTLSRFAALVPKLMAIGVLVLIFLIVLWLFRGFRNRIAGTQYSILTALFLDAETDTYSLSRFQFFIWTAAAILSYLYLLLSRSLIQGRLEFVDVPAGIPGIILVSAGTSVVAQAITKSKGPKGAGEIHPSLADLISTGGVIVPERFQFFVWTVIGAAVFLFLVFLNDPGTIKDLPEVPNGFLGIMGVSSAGYLGGKAARSAGPIIDEIVVRLASLELAIKGRVLSQDASFRINDEEVDSNLIEHLKPEIVEPDDQGGSNTAKLLRLRILTPKPEWLKDGSALTIINPDGQKAAWNYNVGPALTGPVETTRAAQGGDVTIRVKGVNLSEKTKVSLEVPEGTPWAQPVTTRFPDPNTLEVTTNNPQSGVLVLSNTDQRSARIPFTVQ